MTVQEVIIEKFLKVVEEREYLPWQRPYTCYNAFNWATKVPYRGINRLMLEFGEYLTANQINEYNKTHGEDFRFVKGIKWIPVVFYKKEEKSVSDKEIQEVFPNGVDLTKKGYLGNKGSWVYTCDGEFNVTKSRRILRYTDVAERRYFRNSKGEMLPSRLDTGEVEITLSKPNEVFEDYIEREKIFVNDKYNGIPCYIPATDELCLNPHVKNQEAYFSIAFHEAAHSTGAENRLNREGITKLSGTRDEKYAVEELIAEITAGLLCAECGINSFETSCTQEYSNSISYIQSWSKKIRNMKDQFIYIVSQADKAFNYIMGMDI